MNNTENLIDINKTKGLPRSYKFNQFIRWFTIILALLIIVYSLWIVFTQVHSDSSKFQKYLPFALRFLGLKSLLKQLISLNTITFREQGIAFNYIGRFGVKIAWNAMKKMELNDSKHKMIRIKYTDNEEEKTFEFALNFPGMLEIINSIAELCPDLEYDEFLQRVIINDDEVKAYRKKQDKLKESDQ
ncbi:MAG TPA: hypothetical protein ENL09_06460 [Bacteroidetes bacterium]|nr:hypothetical protein [Bacteroidota bacterium]